MFGGTFFSLSTTKSKQTMRSPCVELVAVFGGWEGEAAVKFRRAHGLQ